MCVLIPGLLECALPGKHLTRPKKIPDIIHEKMPCGVVFLSMAPLASEQGSQHATAGLRAVSNKLPVFLCCHCHPVAPLCLCFMCLSFNAAAHKINELKQRVRSHRLIHPVLSSIDPLSLWLMLCFPYSLSHTQARTHARTCTQGSAFI